MLTQLRLIRHSVRAGVVAVLVAGMTVSGMSSARAATSPAPARPTTGVTQDALPTVQIDGVAWAQAIVGNTVYVGGSFANARPAGAAAGTNLTPRSNLLSYNLTTGALIAAFAPSLNGQVKSVVASPDGTRIYVGGSFTRADGVTRNRIAAYSTRTGALITTFDPSVIGTVNSITATNDTVYAGGTFSAVNGVTRARLAAVSAANGALLGWAPTADAGVNAVLLTPDDSHVIVGGAFANINGTSARGLASLDATNGAPVAFAANQVVQDYGSGAAILSLSTDGKAVYGTGYVYGSPGNFEGTFSADPGTGAINWLEDCHGDTYGAFSSGSQVYVVSHEHYCGNIGGFQDTNPRKAWYRSTAFTTAPTGTVSHNSVGRYADFYGQPSPSLLNWFPAIDTGTYTRQTQGSWTVTGTSNYVVEGGEFLHVNGTAQQGLVRFAVPSIATDKFGPTDLGAISTGGSGGATPSVTVTAATTAYDPDDQLLTYQLIRDGDAANPIATQTRPTVGFWLLASRPTVTLTDTTAATGSVHTYRIRVVDRGGAYLDSGTVSATPLSDLALDKPATQSSDARSAPAGRAVDGNTDGDWANRSVTNTSTDAYSWWQVDLQSTTDVGSIGIWNRTDCCGDRLSDYWVFASETPLDSTLTPAQQATQPGVWASHQSAAPAPNATISTAAGTKARYVMVQLNTPNRNLSLAEVQVFGLGTGYLAVAPRSVDLGTVAVGATATATVTISNPGSTAIAIRKYADPQAPFTISPAIAVGQKIPASTSITETITYTPTSAGTDDGAIVIAATDGYPPVTLPLSGATPGGSADLALNAPATQSSDSYGTTAARAVDGNTDGVFNDGSVTNTSTDPYSWWQVDLGATTRLDRTAVWNRTDCCTDRLSNYWVFVSATPFDTGLTPVQQAAQPGVWSSHQTSAPAPSSTLSLPAGTRGRYVMVQENTANQNLSLAEVQVVGPPLGSN